jgi:hypothetical protein
VSNPRSGKGKRFCANFKPMMKSSELLGIRGKHSVYPVQISVNVKVFKKDPLVLPHNGLQDLLPKNLG